MRRVPRSGRPFSGEELDSDKLMREVQDFLRGQREGGAEG